MVVVALFYKLATKLPQHAFGRFVGEVDTTWLPDGRMMKLNKDFAYSDPNHKVWLAPAESMINGASIPRAFWTLIGGPFEGQYRNASVVHDVACEEKKEPSDDVHKMFYFACLCGGVSESKAKAMYYGILLGGPKWNITRALLTRNNKRVVVSNPVDVIEGQPLTQEDAAAIIHYFETHNPSLNEIPTLEILPRQ
jgi:hypothetical protein